MFGRILRTLLWTVFAMVPALALAPAARAVPVTYDFTLFGSLLGSSFGGISSLPAGPFTGSFTLDGPLAPDLPALTPISLTAFSATIGTRSWGLGDVLLSDFGTDASGAITYLDIGAIATGDIELHMTIIADFSLSSWFAIDGPCTLFGVEALEGSCISGGLDDTSLILTQRPLVADVPEPATLALFGAGLAGLAWAARRRKAMQG